MWGEQCEGKTGKTSGNCKTQKVRIFEASFWWPVSVLYWSGLIDSCESGQMSRRESEKGERKRKTSKKDFFNHNR